MMQVSDQESELMRSVNVFLLIFVLGLVGITVSDSPNLGFYTRMIKRMASKCSSIGMLSFHELNCSIHFVNCLLNQHTSH